MKKVELSKKDVKILNSWVERMNEGYMDEIDYNMYDVVVKLLK